MRALYKAPQDKAFREIVIPNNLHTLQQLVGGYIETVTMPNGAVVICNDEGRINDSKYNCMFEGVDFFGTILLVGADGEEFTDCPMSMLEANKGIR